MTDIDQPSVADFLRVSSLHRSRTARHMRRKVNLMTDDQRHSGMATLSICEALLLANNNAHVLSETEIMGVLTHAAVTHENGGGSKSDVEMHLATAALIRRIIAGGNSVRRP